MSRVRLLLYDDDAQLGLSVRGGLSRHGIEVGLAATMDYASQFLRALEFDAALLDWRRGEALAGLRLLAELQPDCARYVLAGTPRDESSYEGELVDRWLAKPVDFDELAEFVGLGASRR